MIVLEENAQLNTSLTRILHSLGIPDWDVVLVGDGSGQKWNIGAGWACAAMVQGDRSATMEWGAWSRGQVMLAELMAYVQGLMTLEFSSPRMKSLREQIVRPLNVIVLTDNQNIVAQSKVCLAPATTIQNRPYVLGPVTDNVNAPLWAALNAVCARGYVMSFHFIPRLSIELNWAADHICGEVRELVQDRGNGELPKGRRVDRMNCS